MRRLLLLSSLCAVSFCGTACAPKPAVTVSPVTLNKPPTSLSAAPTLDAARQASARADLVAGLARASVARAKLGLEETSASLRDAVAEANRLRQQKHATESELITLYNHLLEQERRTKILVSDIIDAEASLIHEKNLRQEVSDRLAESEKLAAAKDNENAELRRLLDYSEQLTEKASVAAQNATNTSTELTKKVGIAEGRATTWRWISIGLGAALVAAVALHVLRSYIRI